MDGTEIFQTVMARQLEAIVQHMSECRYYHS